MAATKKISKTVKAPKVEKPAKAEKVSKVSKTSKASKAVKTSSIEDAVRMAATVLFSKKAEDVVLLDLRGLSTLTDYYLICTCQNEAQMRATLNSVQRALSREGTKALRSEYRAGVRWAVLDYSDLIVHIFEKQARVYYSLERLWGDAKATHLKAEDYASPDEVNLEDEDDDL